MANNIGMWVYFNAKGVCKEVINDQALRVGNSNVNKIFVYWDSDIAISKIGVAYRNKDGEAIGTDEYLQDAYQSVKEIPYNKNRNLEYFSYEHIDEASGDLGYSVYQIDIPDEIFSESQVIACQIRMITNDSKIYTMGLLVFSVEGESIITDNIITQSEWNYLLYKFGRITHLDYLPLDGGTMRGSIDMDEKDILNICELSGNNSFIAFAYNGINITPQSDNVLSIKNREEREGISIDFNGSNYINFDSDEHIIKFEEMIDMRGNPIENVAYPEYGTDATNKLYVDNLVNTGTVHFSVNGTEKTSYSATGQTADNTFDITSEDLGLNDKLDKSATTGDYVYSHNGSIQSEIGYSMAQKSRTMVLRDSYGAILINVPSDVNLTSYHAINAGYLQYNYYNKSTIDSKLASIDQFKYIVSTNASTTPYGIVWYNGSTKITGTLVASANTEFIIYLVPCKHTASETQKGYDEYLTINNNSAYSWEVLGNTADIDLSDYVRVEDKNNFEGDVIISGGELKVQDTITADNGIILNGKKIYLGASAIYPQIYIDSERDNDLTFNAISGDNIFSIGGDSNGTLLKDNYETYIGFNGENSTVDMHQSVDMKSHQITNLANPTNNTDATNKLYVDNKVASIDLSGYVKTSDKNNFTGNITVSGSGTISTVGSGTTAIVNKGYVDTAINNAVVDTGNIPEPPNTTGIYTLKATVSVSSSTKTVSTPILVGAIPGGSSAYYNSSTLKTNLVKGTLYLQMSTNNSTWTNVGYDNGNGGWNDRSDISVNYDTGVVEVEVSASPLARDAYYLRISSYNYNETSIVKTLSWGGNDLLAQGTFDSNGAFTINTSTIAFADGLYFFTYGNTQAFGYITASMLANSATSPIRIPIAVIYNATGSVQSGFVRLQMTGTNTLQVKVANESKTVYQGYTMYIYKV